MRYRYLDDFRRGISVFAIFSYGIAVLGTPQCPPPRGFPWWNSSQDPSGSLRIVKDLQRSWRIRISKLSLKDPRGNDEDL